MDIHDDLIYSHTRCDVISYLRSPFIEVENTAENATTNGFVSNFSGAAILANLHDILSSKVTKIIQ